MKTSTIKKTIELAADPHEVFETLMDSKKHGDLTGSKAIISRKLGGKFKVYDGYIYGENLELDKDKRIVLSWRAREDCWPEGHYSKVVFLLSKTEMGTKLIFTHSGIPSECGKMFDEGWNEFYWEPLRERFEKR